MTEQEFQGLKDAAVAATVRMLEAADELGKDQSVVAMEFMGAFAAAAEKTQVAA